MPSSIAVRVSVAGGILAVLLILAGLTTATGYDISAEQEVAVPDRTVDFQGRSYAIESTVKVDAGRTLSVDVSAPDEVYRLYLYNSDENIVASRRGDGSGSFSIDVSTLEPGSYALTTYHDGEYETILPVLVPGYDVAHQAPEQVTPSEEFEVTVTVDEAATTTPPPAVQVVIADGDETVTVDASQSGDEYVATIDADRFTPGTYTSYALVRGESRAFGERTLLGLSSGVPITVESATQAPTETPTESDSGDGQQPPSSPTDPTETQMPTSPPPTTPPETPTAGPGTDVTTAPPTSAATPPPTPPTSTGPPTTERSPTTRPGSDTDAGGTPSTDSVITPGGTLQTPSTQSPTTGDASPGFTVAAVLGALLCLVALGRHSSW